MTEIVGIYDKIFKRIITLSQTAVINFINSMFYKELPLNSEILYNWTENITDELGKTLSDTILTINKIEKFHIEVQTSRDDSMVLRVFDYGYQEARKYKKVTSQCIRLEFPEARIIYLNHNKNTPDEVTLELDFKKQGIFKYKVETIKLLNYSINELSEKKMAIMLPLYLLKLRKKTIQKHPKRNAKALNSLIHDIILEIEKNESAKNISYDDKVVLMNLLTLLYNNLYGDINEFKEEGVGDMLAERLITYTEQAVIKERKRIVMNCFNKGMDINEIADLTGLTIEQINEIRSLFANPIL